jgi:hypothetical protein
MRPHPKGTLALLHRDFSPAGFTGLHSLRIAQPGSSGRGHQPIMPIISSSAKKIINTIETAIDNRNSRRNAPKRDSP